MWSKCTPCTAASAHSFPEHHTCRSSLKDRCLMVKYWWTVTLAEIGWTTADYHLRRGTQAAWVDRSAEHSATTLGLEHSKANEKQWQPYSSHTASPREQSYADNEHCSWNKQKLYNSFLKYILPTGPASCSVNSHQTRGVELTLSHINAHMLKSTKLWVPRHAWLHTLLCGQLQMTRITWMQEVSLSIFSLSAENFMSLKI